MECRHCGAIPPEFDTHGLRQVLAKIEGYDFDDPRRRTTLRAQLTAMEMIRDTIVMRLDGADAERWVAALEPLTQRIVSELALQEGTGTLGAVLDVFEGVA